MVYRLIKSFIVLNIIFLFLFNNNASGREIDYFANPQAGAWFGVLTPMGSTYEQLNTYLGGGGFVRSTTPLDDLKIGLESSYQEYRHKGLYGVNGLTLVPVYGNLVYRLPLPSRVPLTFQLKAGAGGSWVRLKPDNIAQWDPVGMIGLEGSFGAGRLLNVGFRIDYLCVYEKHIDGASRNGHFLNTGITLFFNLW